MFKLYRLPTTGEATIIGADPADGGSDYCAAVAKSRKHADTFLVYHNRTTSAQFGYELVKMAQFIFNHTGIKPIIAVERNVGMATLTILQQQNYPYLFRMPKLGVHRLEDDEKIGWMTNTQTRPKMLDELSLSLTQQVNKIPDKETIREMLSFIRNPTTGKPEASGSAKDDLVMAEAIAWQVYQLAPNIQHESITTLINQFPRQELFDRYGNPTV